jgi:Short C-terminal domain
MSDAGFQDARYLGGFPRFEKHRQPQKQWGNGYLSFRNDALDIQMYRPFSELQGVIRYEDIMNVEVADTDQMAKSKVVPVVLFGVLGLAAKGSEDRTSIAVHTKDNEMAYFQIVGESAPLVRAKIDPLLKNAGVIRGATVPETGASSIPDEISKLVAMRDQGVLSAEQFEAAKSKLLG